MVAEAAVVLPLGKTSVSLYNINMKKVKKPAPVLNRRAHYDYNLSDKVEVGMVLTGPQVRLIRDRHVQLKGTYVTIRNHELWLLGLTLGSDTSENIKLLATKSQIAALKSKAQLSFQSNSSRPSAISSSSSPSVKVKRPTISARPSKIATSTANHAV